MQKRLCRNLGCQEKVGGGRLSGYELGNGHCVKGGGARNHPEGGRNVAVMQTPVDAYALEKWRSKRRNNKKVVGDGQEDMFVSHCMSQRAVRRDHSPSKRV